MSRGENRNPMLTPRGIGAYRAARKPDSQRKKEFSSLRVWKAVELQSLSV
jgi:hypothetical protein